MMMKNILLLLLLATACNSLKVLVISPLFGHSHSNFLGRLADTLTESNHNVTVVMPVMDVGLLGKTGLKTTKDLRILEASPEVIEVMESSEKRLAELWEMTPDPFSLIKVAANMSRSFSLSCRDFVHNKTMMEQLRNEHFDVAIAEPFIFCPFGIFELIGIKNVIGAVSTTHMDYISGLIGEPLFPSYTPSGFSEAGDKMTFKERMVNFAGSFATSAFFKQTFDAELEVLRSENSSLSHYSDLFADLNFVFTNSNPYLNFPRPINPKTIEIGGIVVDKVLRAKKNLGEKFEKILNERKNTVLVSFGSVAKSKFMPDHFKQGLLKAFEELKDVTFIWKYEEDTDIAAHLPNVHLSKWVPQVALLNDDRLDLFITHGGLGSTTEVAYLGKPAIFFPLFGDQPRNAKMAARFGGALALKKLDLQHPEVLIAAIKEILNNQTYIDNAQRLSFVLNNNPINAKELIIKHVEFAGKVGKIPNLESQARNLNFVQYFMLDVIAFLVVALILIILIIVFIFKKLIALCCRTKAKKE